jgi:3-dehydroquinate dehydratase-2
MTTPTILMLSGPNLNLLGEREAHIYGSTTLADIETAARTQAGKHGLALEAKQSNIEGELVTWVQQARKSAAGVIVNAGAYTHTSIALHDAFKALGKPFIEVHLSNLYAREDFRHHSYLAPLASGVIIGLGAQGYALAVDALAALIHKA